MASMLPFHCYMVKLKDFNLSVLLLCSGYYDEKLETFVEIPSDNCQFNEKPYMKAKEITAAGKEALTSGKFQMVRVNYANPGESSLLAKRRQGE